MTDEVVGGTRAILAALLLALLDTAALSLPTLVSFILNLLVIVVAISLLFLTGRLLALIIVVITTIAASITPLLCACVHGVIFFFFKLLGPSFGLFVIHWSVAGLWSNFVAISALASFFAVLSLRHIKIDYFLLKSNSIKN